MTETLLDKANALLEARSKFPHRDVTVDKFGSPVLYGVTKGGCNLEEARWRMADIRGWGSLSYLGEDEAIAIQEGMADYIALAANTSTEIIQGYQDMLRRMVNVFEYIIPRLEETGTGLTSKLNVCIDAAKKASEEARASIPPA